MTAVNPFADEVVHLRHWGTDQVFALSSQLESACYIGSAGGCALQLPVAHVAPRHARIIRVDKVWSMASLGGSTALRVDGQWCKELVLSPGTEVGIGGATLIAESPHWISLRAFCARVLGWGHDRAWAIDHALRAIRLAASRRAPLVLAGRSPPRAEQREEQRVRRVLAELGEGSAVWDPLPRERTSGAATDGCARRRAAAGLPARC